MQVSGEDQIQLSEQTFLILLSLRRGPKHGYAIAADVRSISNERVRLSVSTLYTTLKRLLDSGWVRMAAEEGGGPGRPRKTYELTRAGARVLEAEVERMDWLVQRARRLPQEGAA
jgi:DNA-binding PadR family transcriptional regulator